MQVNLVHEVGHSLGMSHDGENGFGCPDRPKFIMNAYAAEKILWSRCSSQQVLCQPMSRICD